jgi:hypothetical protein
LAFPEQFKRAKRVCYNVLGADGGELLPGTDLDTGTSQELVKIAHIGPA